MINIIKLAQSTIMKWSISQMSICIEKLEDLLSRKAKDPTVMTSTCIEIKEFLRRKMSNATKINESNGGC